MKDYYQILGVTDAASQSEIKAAFKKMAILFHPDKHNGNPVMEERFKEINEAYQTLSDPSQKARYDFSRSFKTGETVDHTPVPRRYPPPRPPKPEIDWEAERKANYYVLGFFAIIISFLFGLVYYIDYSTDKEVDQKLAERRLIFDDATAAYNRGDYYTAYSKMESLGNFLQKEGDYLKFKKQMLKEFESKAIEYSELEDFKEAIRYFELLDKFSPNYSYALREQQALIYRKIGQPNKAINTLTYLIINNFQKLENYITIAEIAQNELQDLPQAITYYETARKYAEQSYKAQYGTAYTLLINKDNIPATHYRLYTGLANSYMQKGNYADANETAIWNIQIWPDSVLNYTIAAACSWKLGDQKAACAFLSQAKNLGFTEELNISCQ